MAAGNDDMTTDTTADVENGVSGSEVSPADANGGGDIHSYIGARLRRVFDDVANQPVPDRFLQLMQELDRA